MVSVRGRLPASVTRAPMRTSETSIPVGSIGRARDSSLFKAAARAFRYSWRWRADLYSKFSRRSPKARASSIALRLAGISLERICCSSARLAAIDSGVA